MECRRARARRVGSVRNRVIEECHLHAIVTSPIQEPRPSSDALLHKTELAVEGNRVLVRRKDRELDSLDSIYASCIDCGTPKPRANAASSIFR
jgi:hypothetical protein